ncbi:transcription antitermination factor NusB [Paenibacillus sp. FSL R5-0527]|uniref:transcription antitermination factor NusB n=1 Tax=Paenibacillus TaxID=44249 RepID=UPI00097A4870|nr:transcription antitermination factor NusB [Paenibacillus macerans]MDU5948046.1 transcription antitermination factor NusB [Paenibacillus macerans]MEC0331557.1 transcription antitermination factor NusB [Paenibacillus macerans]MED4958788.1 transcription antitermination factor NusB [Paenibacillus macerans]OMG48551.1 N utilization substance protein B [Paenibacillus macerans]
MKRRLAREIAIQSLYHMEMNEVEAEEAVSMLLSEAAGDNEGEVKLTDAEGDKAFVLELVNGTWSRKDAIDGLLSDYLKGWQISRLSKVDRQVLRLAAYEMIFRDDVPGKVAVNEAIELAKHFGTEESGKFVNGVLGKMIQDVEQLKSKI